MRQKESVGEDTALSAVAGIPIRWKTHDGPCKKLL